MKEMEPSLEMANSNGPSEAGQVAEGRSARDRFSGKIVVDTNEVIFRILCAIKDMDDHDKSSAYQSICGIRLRFIGHEVWEPAPDDTRAFPPDTAGEFLAITESEDQDGAWRKRLTHHQLFDNMIEELEEMDTDALAKAYEMFSSYRVDSCYSDENRIFFVTVKEEQK